MSHQEKVFVDCLAATKLIEDLFEMQIEEKEFKELKEYINDFQTQEDNTNKIGRNLF